MKRSSLISAGSLNRTLQAVSEAWNRSQFEPAIAMLERARRLSPSNLDILLYLGRCHGLRQHYPAAEECFEQAVRIAPRKADVLGTAGQQCRDFNNLTLATGYLQRAAELPGVSPATLVHLAEIYDRLRRVDEAALLVERALRSDAACGPALLLRAKLDRQAGRLDEAEKQLRAFPAGTEPALQASARYELGGILDRQGRYDEAMAAWLEAKASLQLLADRPRAELKVMRARVHHLTANATSEILRQWRDAAEQLQPPHRLALLAGHPRSGTTLLEQVLDAHPDMVSVEETEIFKKDAYVPLMQSQPDDIAMYAALAAATPGALQTARQNYFRAMESALGQPVAGRLLIDKNPSYTCILPALIRFFPEIKFLIALRDPRDVVLSCFMQNLPLNQVGAACLTLAGTVEEYSTLMGAWLAMKSRMQNPHLEVRYEDMVDDLEPVARKTLEFLGVTWDATVLGFDRHAREKVVRSPTYADVTQPVYKRALGRWRHYQKHLEPHLAKLEPFVKAFGYE